MEINTCVCIQVYDTMVKVTMRQGMLGPGGDWRPGDSQHNLALVFLPN